MSNVKKPATTEEQISILQSHGCLIENEDFCKEKLKLISYYRLSAYFLPFKLANGRYVEGASFKSIYEIYEFDRKLRSLLFSAIETVEISLRSQLSQYHALKYGALGYMKSENFNAKHDHNRFVDSIEREKEKNNRVSFVKHHNEKYEGQFPIWVIMELFTFGMLSYFYNDLSTQDRKAVARQNENNYADMGSWLRCCTDLRNICAHYGRLYNRTFTAVPSGLSLNDDQKRRLWGALLALRGLFPSTELWNKELVPQLEKLISDYSSTIEIALLGFPENWKEIIEK